MYIGTGWISEKEWEKGKKEGENEGKDGGREQMCGGCPLGV